MNSFYSVFASFVFFLLFSKKISHFLSCSIPKYSKLSDQQKRDWNERNASTVHAIIVSLLCVYVLIFEEPIKKNLVIGYSRIAEANIELSIGFLLADVLIMAVDRRNWRKNWGYVVHHISSVYAFRFSVVYGLLSYFANFRLLAELSTPFVNLRWALSATDSKGGTLYVYNGIIMTFAFFVSRILIMPYFYYMVYQVLLLEEYDKNISSLVHVSWISVCVILDVLNVMWFRKMWNGALHHLKPHKTETPTSNGKVALGKLN